MPLEVLEKSDSLAASIQQYSFRTQIIICVYQGDTLLKSIQTSRKCSATLVSGNDEALNWLILLLFYLIRYLFTFFSLSFVVVAVVDFCC